MKEESAVEYIKKKLQGYGFDFGYVLDKAKEMEKEQIIKAYWAAYKEALHIGDKTADEYYNETYKKTEQ